MDYGKKIAYLRRTKGMTQEELGRELNVTYQAVSKWERGESQPDFTTMTQIAKIFQVPIDYFVYGNENSYTDAVESENTSEPTNVIMHDYAGVCTECGKMLSPEEVYSSSPKLICKDCAERREKDKLQEEQARERRREVERQKALGRNFDAKLILSLIVSLAVAILITVACFKYKENDANIYMVLLFLAPVTVFGIFHSIWDFFNDLKMDYDPEYKRNVSLIAGGIFSAVNLVLYLILFFVTKQSVYLGIMAVAIVVSFTFVSQFAWGGVIQEIFTAGGFTFKMPGFIFSLDIDSILWMIVVKLFLGIIAGILFIVTTVVLALVAIFGSVFTFIPCILWKTRKDFRAKQSLLQ